MQGTEAFAARGAPGGTAGAWAGCGPQAAPTDRFCGLINLPITPPDEFVAAVRIGLTLCSCWAVCAWSGPNSVFDDVSLPVRNTPSHPRNAATNGNTNPVFEKAMARLDVMPEKFIR